MRIQDTFSDEAWNSFRMEQFLSYSFSLVFSLNTVMCFIPIVISSCSWGMGLHIEESNVQSTLEKGHMTKLILSFLIGKLLLDSQWWEAINVLILSHYEMGFLLFSAGWHSCNLPHGCLWKQDLDGSGCWQVNLLHMSHRKDPRIAVCSISGDLESLCGFEGFFWSLLEF